jgi:hypothetical protein
MAVLQNQHGVFDADVVSWIGIHLDLRQVPETIRNVVVNPVKDVLCAVVPFIIVKNKRFECLEETLGKVAAAQGNGGISSKGRLVYLISDL